MDTPQPNYEEGRSWAWKRSRPYRIIGSIFLLVGGFPLVFAFIHSPPWWFYLLPLSGLIPGFVILSYSEGILIESISGNVVKWFKILGCRKQRTVRIADLIGVGLEERARSSGSVHSMAFDLYLYSEDSSLRIFTSSIEQRAKEEMDKIVALTGLPEIEPPTLQEISSRMIIGIIAAILLIPLLLLGLFLLVRFMGG